MQYPPKVLDLFCGVGGLSAGFIKAGFKVTLAVDLDTDAVETYKANLGSHANVYDLASQNMDLPPATVIVGGPPCQGFSSAGLRKPGDKRNTLVKRFASIVAELKPVAFVFENVEGFLTTESGAYVFDLLVPLVNAGYRIHLRKVNAANYGVPQHRKRVIAVGGLGWNPSFPSPTHTAFGAPGAHLAARHLPATPSLMHALKDLPLASTEYPGVPQDHFYKPLIGIDLERARTLKPGQTMRDLPRALWHESYRRRAFRRVKDGTPSERRGGAPAGLRRLSPGEPSKAITSSGPSEFLHPIEARCLTIRECARLQTFPDEFCFRGTLAKRAQLIGNAVPPLLAFVIAKSLMSDLQRAKPTSRTGELLSFVPTLSSGMSPALEGITNKIRAIFSTTVVPEVEQRHLWV